jgi:hypothetical protein
MTVAMIGTLEAAHPEQISRETPPTARSFPAESPTHPSVDECDDGNAEFFSELHQPQRLAVSLGVRHPEVSLENFLRVATALLPMTITVSPSVAPSRPRSPRPLDMRGRRATR